MKILFRIQFTERLALSAGLLIAIALFAMPEQAAARCPDIDPGVALFVVATMLFARTAASSVPQRA
ncbi:hypothetical protein [Nocardia sp. NPDC051833]|uniref:hypothetical protein n=1 Tax=Nocardia sp. NPDC051833 TaxID=3155674 RepID=UPI003438177A